MSTQRGNVKKKGPPKHQNKRAFKNNMHDSSRLTQQLNEMEISGVCNRCKDILEWKIRYKKYKPLTAPKKCTKCGQKSVKKAYCLACEQCAKSLGICAKCGLKEDIVLEPGLSPAEEASQQSQLEQELKFLSERKRRTFHRLQAAGKQSGDPNDIKDIDLSDDDDSDLDVQASAKCSEETRDLAVSDDEYCESDNAEDLEQSEYDHVDAR